MKRKSSPSSFLGFAAKAYLGGLTGWVLWRLLNDTAPRMLAQDQNKLRGAWPTVSETEDKGAYTVTHALEDGIERITYTPKERKYAAPILMAHGMWHGAWCWQPWQEILAEKGWESVAYSLPGHGQSPTQRSLTTCTLGYYLAFLRDEVERMPVRPVLMGHSMGGALSQWVLRYITQDLPAVVLVAPWVSHSMLAEGFWRIIQLDPLGVAAMLLTWNSTAWMRSPAEAASKLISAEAVVSPEELHRRLGGESGLVIFQHNPPFWKPAENVKTPVLLLAGEKDTLISVEGLRQTASHYQAEFVVIPDAGHNLMMEKSYRETAESIERWLMEKIG